VTGESGDVRLEVNRWVFRCFLEVLRVLQCRTSAGKLFLTSGAERRVIIMPMLMMIFAVVWSQSRCSLALRLVWFQQLRH